MIQIKRKEDCCGCNACGDVCPKNAISYKTDKEGFWYPSVDMERCIDCHLCEKVCPIINVGELKKNDFEEPRCFVAENKSIDVVFDSTSGGVFSALASFIYKEKGYVGGAIFNEDFSVRHYISANKNDLPALRSSKYLQSNLEGFFTEVKNLLIKGETVFVCGSPCQMAALRAFLKKDYDNLFIADYICRGINSPKVWHKYLDSFEERYGSKVIYAKAKSKEYGWHKLTQKVILEDGKHVYEPVDVSNFTKGYLTTGAYCRPSCYECKFKGFPRIADITLGDFWGISEFDKSWDKDLGISLVMINSKKGEMFFDKVKNRLNYRSLSFDQCSKNNPSLYSSLNPPKVDRQEFFEDMDKMSFEDIAKKYINVPPKLSLRHGCGIIYRNVVKLLNGIGYVVCNPMDVIRMIRYNKIKNLIHGRVLRVLSHCAIDVSSNSSVNIWGHFTLGTKRVKGSKHESRLLVGKGAKLQVKGKWNVFYGADIEVFEGATLEVGKTTRNKGGANLDLTIVCANKISIGDNVQIGRHVTIRDNNGKHYMNLRGYKDENPIVIGDKVWLCEGCTIMPGAHIGDGAIIGAYSVVYGNVPDHCLVSGNPAQIVEKDVLWLY